MGKAYMKSMNDAMHNFTKLLELGAEWMMRMIPLSVNLSAKKHVNTILWTASFVVFSQTYLFPILVS